MNDFEGPMRDAAFETAIDWFIDGRSKRDVSANLRRNFSEISARDRQVIISKSFENAKRQTRAQTSICKICGKVYDDRLYMPDYCEVCGETSMTEPENVTNKRDWSKEFSRSSGTLMESDKTGLDYDPSRIAIEPWRLAEYM